MEKRTILEQRINKKEALEDVDTWKKQKQHIMC